MKRILIILTLIIFSFTAGFSDDYGLTSFPVLMMDNYSAAALSMANSTAAMYTGADALFHNPAAAASSVRMSASVSRLGWLFDSAFNSAAFIYPLAGQGGKYGVLGITGVFMDTPGQELYADGIPLGTNASGDFLLGFTWANNLFRSFNADLAGRVHLDFGITVKYAQARLADYNAGALAFDAGFLYSVRVPNLSSWLGVNTTEALPRTFITTNQTNVLTQVTSNWTLTVITTNKGPKSPLIMTNSRSTNSLLTVSMPINQVITNTRPVRIRYNMEDTLSASLSFRGLSAPVFTYLEGQDLRAPWTFDLGVYYTVYDDSRHHLGTSLALSQPSDSHILLSAGAEYSYKETIYLRGGYRLVGRGYDGLSIGFGFRFEVSDDLALQLDYSRLMLSDFGGSDVFTLGVTF